MRLNKLIAVVNSNLPRSDPRGWRYNDPDILDLAMLFYDTMGRQGYELLRLSFGGRALPTPVTLKAHPQFLLPPITDAGFQLDRLRRLPDLYKALGYNLPLFGISDDATALRKSLFYRRSDNLIIGWSGAAVPCPDSLFELERMAAERKLASQVSPLMLNPIDPSYPSVVVAVFFDPPGAVSTATIVSRTDAALDVLYQLGIIVIAHGADGASQNVAMHERRLGFSVLPRSTRHLVPDTKIVVRFPALLSMELQQHALAARRLVLHIGDEDVPADVPIGLCFQDFVHVLAKLRMRLLKAKDGLKLGDGVAHVAVLQHFVRSPAHRINLELSTLLRAEDLDPSDPMDYPAAERMCSAALIDFLAEVAANADVQRPVTGDVHQTLLYVKLMSLVRKAYVEPGVNCLDRLRAAFTALFISDIWSEFATQYNTPAAQLITRNVRFCLRANAISLLGLYVFICSHRALRRHVPASPHVFGSQANEHLFRVLRALLADVNFGAAEMLRRLNAVARTDVLVSRNRADATALPLDVPRHHRHPRADSLHRPAEYMDDSLTVAAMETAMVESKQAAICLWYAHAGRFLPLSVAVPLGHPLPPEGSAERPVVRVTMTGEANFVRELPLDLVAALDRHTPATAPVAAGAQSNAASAVASAAGAAADTAELDVEAELDEGERLYAAEIALQKEAAHHEARSIEEWRARIEDAADEEEGAQEQLDWQASVAAARQAAADVADGALAFDLTYDAKKHVHVDIGQKDAPAKLKTLLGTQVSKARAVNIVGGHTQQTSERLRRVRDTNKAAKKQKKSAKDGDD